MKETDTEKKGHSRRLDWKPIIAAFRDAFEWALDIAADFAREYPDEVAAVERVRAGILLQLAGWPVDEPSLDDVAFTFALFIGALERAHGSLGRFGKLLVDEGPRMIARNEISIDDLSRVAFRYWLSQSRRREAA